MSEQITGACLCGAVRFSVDNAFATLFFCHCDQCRKMTGGSHAANLFIEPACSRVRASCCRPGAEHFLRRAAAVVPGASRSSPT